MHLISNLLDKPIITANEGRIVGAAKAFLFSPDWKSVTAVSLGGEGLFSRKFSVIVQNNIGLFGVDALLIKQASAPIDSSQVAELATWFKRDDLKGRAIETPGGTKIGTIGDIIIDPQGQIIGFKLAQLLVQGTLANRGYISRGCVVDLLTSGGLMTIDLAKAEQQTLGDKIELHKASEEVAA